MAQTDVIGGAGVALLNAKNTAVLGGQFGGVAAPIKQASRYFTPQHMFADTSANTLATTAARYYVTPFYVDRATTFVGAWTFNGGAGDNGKKCKIAAYNEASAGGPGTLAKNFGEVTLTGASAARTFASSWAASPGWYFLEFVNDNSVTMFCMNNMSTISGAGVLVPNMGVNLLGVTTPTVGASVTTNIPSGEYVGGTYANFPEATSLTPTTSTFSSNSQFPIFGLYT